MYLLASRRNGVLYVGVTSALYDRMIEHRAGCFDGFTKRYGVKQLVYCEFHHTMADAITRESRLKKWQRAWKVRLINTTNPEWLDLFDPNIGIKPAPADVERLHS